jgi:hypothetical protein
MRAVRVLHFGDDASHRMQVLRSKGYVVESCANLQQMIARLRTGHNPDMVCISEDPWCTADGAVAVARAFSPAPLVLFRANYRSYVQRGWDLEVAPLTSPVVWLEELAELLRSLKESESTEFSRAS